MHTSSQLKLEDREILGLLHRFLYLAVETGTVSATIASPNQTSLSAKQRELLDLAKRIESQLVSHIDHEEKFLHDSHHNQEFNREMLYRHLMDHSTLSKATEKLVGATSQDNSDGLLARMATQLVVSLSNHNRQFDKSIGQSK